MKRRGPFHGWQSSFKHPLEDNEKTTIFVRPVCDATALIYPSCRNVYAMDMRCPTLPAERILRIVARYQNQPSKSSSRCQPLANISILLT